MSRSKSSDFIYQDKLGEGTYGQVYKAMRKADEQLYVIKKVNISELSKKEQLAAINEVKLLSRMDNAHVVQYFDSFIDEGALHIVMEFCDKGDLSHMMKRTKDKGKYVPEPRIWSIFCQVNEGKNIRFDSLLLLLLLLLV
jgi:serine/threonine protein kinase